MSRIFKLSIQGIRSFDNADRETIQFGTPLTLIVGQNGTGKTTIIECLRYAATGDLPPNSKGGAFIHDPKISGDREVMAQVKLAFINTNKVQMICTRSMQLLVKRTARTFKTLEGQLLAINQGQRSTLSTKCAELDAQMPLYLGVSKSILDYVIFCHQEDSLWPLAEPSVVKKRFDEIFEATKFTKALDNIKSLRKDYATTIKLQEKEVQHLKIEKERAEKAEARADQLQKDIDMYREETEMLQKEIDQVTEESTKLFESNQQFQQVIYKLESLREARKSAVENIEQRSQGLEEMSESDEELKSILANFQSDVDKKKEDVDKLQQTIESTQANIERARQNYNQAIILEGKLKAELDAHNDRLEQRKEFVTKRVSEFELPGLDDGALDEPGNVECYREFRDNLESKFKELKDKEESSRNEGKARENEVAQKIQDLTTEKTVEDQKRAGSKDALAKLESEINKLQSDIDMVTADEGTLEYERSEIKSLEENLAKEKESLEVAAYSEKVKEKEKAAKELDELIESLNSELAKSNQQVDNRAKLSILQADFDRRKRALDALVEANKDNYERVIGSPVESGAEEKVRTTIAEVQTKVDELQQKVSALNKELAQLSTKKAIIEDDLQKNMAKSKQLRTEIKELIGHEASPSEYSKMVEEYENDYDEAAAVLEASNFTAKFYDSAIKMAKEEPHVCALCSRGFDNDGARNEFVETLQQKADVAKNKQLAREQFDEIKQSLESLRGIGSSVTEMARLEDVVIPGLRNELDTYTQEVSDNERYLDGLNDTLERLQSRLSDADSLKRFASDWSRIQREFMSVELQIDELTESLGEENTRSASEIHKLLKSQNEKSKALHAEISSLISEQNEHKTRISSLQNRVSEKKLQLNKVEYEINEKHNKMNRVKEAKKEIGQQKIIIKEANSRLESLIGQISDLEKTRTRISFETEQGLQGIVDIKGRVYHAMQEYDNLAKAIDSYESSQNGKDRLETCHLEVEKHTESIKALETKLQEMNQQVKQADKVLVNLDTHKRALQDNLDVRHLRRQLQETDKSIAELEQKHAERDKERYDQEAAKLKERLASLNSEFSGKQGEMRQMTDQLNRVNEELESEYKNSKEHFRMAQVKHKTTTVANEDLAKYSKALDNAIMKYHSLKMEEINRIIDELWKKTYTGTDVDTIIIRSDNESAKGNRAYNYRVCMVKQDVELDMRGRCSAGQKVLASIIIRLALAECFGTNCGVIALDEPTTNLDSVNAESLAKSLGAIIELRKVQKNFQLIIITHDENFLTHVGASSYTDHFYRVYRDSKQHSKIKSVPISRIIE
uniref:DNA repair protein RAD50 n=1 Tax=Blastobotrys adeninivorans TaxID=409370 RepID=A0A060TDF0_BLAAD